VLSASAQNNDYNMVIELKNGTKITLGADDVENLTFNDGALSISGNTIEDIYTALANKVDQSEFEEWKALLSRLQEIVEPSPIKEYTVNGVSFKMVRVEGGTFLMGATQEQGSDAYDNEKPVHCDTLTTFYIGETEVTQALWYAVMGQKPTSDGGQWVSTVGLGDNFPAYYVSWDDCQTFIQTLNTLTGLSFRLPTEAEWEFAARGGNLSRGYKYAGSNTIDDVAWYWGNIPTQTSGQPGYGSQPVATKAPNELGLYDMSGNIYEWCQDWYGSYESIGQTDPTGPSSGTSRVSRGGCWSAIARGCRVSDRGLYTPSKRDYRWGLRLAL
jgi:formylglycine-generating enzyme required for sulfatase activity